MDEVMQVPGLTAQHAQHGHSQAAEQCFHKF